MESKSLQRTELIVQKVGLDLQLRDKNWDRSEKNLQIYQKIDFRIRSFKIKLEKPIKFSVQVQVTGSS